MDEQRLNGDSPEPQPQSQNMAEPAVEQPNTVMNVVDLESPVQNKGKAVRYIVAFSILALLLVAGGLIAGGGSSEESQNTTTRIDSAADSERRTDINALLNSVVEYERDNGSPPTALTAEDFPNADPYAFVDPNGELYNYVLHPEGCSDSCLSVEITANLSDGTQYSKSFEF